MAESGNNNCDSRSPTSENIVEMLEDEDKTSLVAPIEMKKRKESIGSSWVWKHFRKKEDGDKEFVFCSLCSKDVKYGLSRSTGVLQRHIRVHHRDVYEGGESENREKKKAKIVATTFTVEPSDLDSLSPLSFSSVPLNYEFLEEFFAADGYPINTLTDKIKSLSLIVEPSVIFARRMLHKHPELMYKEKKTSQIIQHILKDVIGVPFTTGWGRNIHSSNSNNDHGGHGIVVDLGTGHSPCVLLRADMDGLPITEETTSRHGCCTSHTPGLMHACGHDAHMAMLLGATAILKHLEQHIHGTIRIIFQPAEEGGAGAKRMIEEGVLSNHPPVQHAFAMHVWPTLPSGAIGGRRGSVLSAVENFTMSITGVGGHAAMPHLTIDPVVAASAMVLGAQTLVSRRLSPLESGVLSITQIDTGRGNAMNVIPASVTLGGTIRALSTDSLSSLRNQFMQFAEQCALTHGCSVTNLSFSPDSYPPTINDTELWDFASQVASSVAIDTKVVEVEPTMGAEDFAFIAEKIASAFFFLGQGSGVDPPTNYGLHHPKFAVDESILVQGVQLHVNLALCTLKKLTCESNFV